MQSFELTTNRLGAVFEIWRLAYLSAGDSFQIDYITSVTLRDVLKFDSESKSQQGMGSCNRISSK